MGGYRPRKAILYTTVSLTALILSGVAFQSAIAGEIINYTGTSEEFSKLDSSGVIKPTDLSENTVTVSDPNNLGADFKAPKGVTGGAGTLSTSGNSVLVSGGAISGNVTGGESSGIGFGTLSISGNSILVSGGTISGRITGGTGSNPGTVTVTGNSVEVFGGAISRDVTGGSGTGSGTVTVTGNSVEVFGGAISRNVTGGSGTGYGTGSGTVTVTGNSVEVFGGAISRNVYGGSGNGPGEVTRNTVTMTGGTVKGDVYGGYSSDGSVQVTDNTVTMTGGTVEGSLYGGYSKTRNEEVISDFNFVAKGNTLNIDRYSGSVGGIYNFQYYDWVLPKNIVNGDVLITITGDTPVDLTNTIHTVAIENDSKRLNVGDQIVMIDKATGDPSQTPNTIPSELQQGHFITYDVEMQVDDDDQFVLKIKDSDDLTPDPDPNPSPNPTPPDEAGRTNPRTKALLEGRAAALGFLSQGSDLIATAGIDNVRVMVRSKDNAQNYIPFLPFLITKGASNRYDTGSHVKVNGFQMAAGLASGAELEQGHKITLGAFFEYGRGTYHTHNSFANYASVRGDGDTHYTGGGIFGRFDFANTGLGLVNDLAPTQADGLYLEASLRAGRVSMGFDSADLIDPEGYRGNYNSKSNYWGGHAAAGYVFNFDERQALDIYGRYLWTHMKGDSVTIGKDRLHFDSATSNRVQLGGRYTYTYNDQFKPYIGAAYEYEFSGDIGAHAYNLRLDEPSLKGSTGIIEAGFSFMPNAKSPDFSINVTGQAYFGQRQGGSGEIKLKYQF